ncbi:MAG: phosphodiesterase [Gammaproteobacteria bacterium]|nr:MAG: phosphodiesterase [Gammaproteobacteria bacterium]
MDTTEELAAQSTRFEIAQLLLERLPICLGVTAGFCLVQVFAWVSNFISWHLVVWSVFAVSVLAGGWLFIRRLSETYKFVGMNVRLVEDINNLTLVLSIAVGIIWATASVIQFFAQGSDHWLYFSIIIGAAASSGILFNYNIRASLISVAMVLLPCTVQVYLSGHEGSLYFTAFTLIYMATLYFVMIQLHQLLEKNVSLRMNSEESARKQAELSYLFEQHWQNAPLAAVQWDKNQHIIDWNPSAEKLFGYPKQEVIGKHADFFVPASSQDKSKSMWHALMRKKIEGNLSVHEVLDKSGATKICEWHNTPLLKDGKLIGVASFVEDITSQVTAKETIQRQATVDTLTSLPNRRRMMEELDSAISRSQRHKQFGAVIFLDLDHFKDINDTQGHHVGDLVLQYFAELLRKAVRAEDVVARFGGDEFVILVQDLGSKPQEARAKVLTIADKIMEMGKTACKQEGLEYEIEVSGGIVMFRGNHYSSNDLLKQADLAMYKVKNYGRKGFSFYDDSMAVEAEYRVTMIRELRQGIENGEFELHFQPLINTGGDLVFAESLLRWKRPSQRIVPAGEFIDFMSSLPMMTEVGVWVFDSVCEHIREWKNQGKWRSDCAIFVNISPKQFEDEQFAQQVKETIRKHGISPNQLVLEITEESLINNLDRVHGQLKELIDFGLRIALDDFGTGYSSLAMLQKLPVQFVKLDREFINDLSTSKDTYSIVKAVIKLCHILSLEVIAEGVETEDQHAILKQLGCNYFQGYYFDKPMEAASFTKLINNADAAEDGEQSPHLKVVS